MDRLRDFLFPSLLAASLGKIFPAFSANSALPIRVFALPLLREGKAVLGSVKAQASLRLSPLALIPPLLRTSKAARYIIKV